MTEISVMAAQRVKFSLFNDPLREKKKSNFKDKLIQSEKIFDGMICYFAYETYFLFSWEYWFSHIYPTNRSNPVKYIPILESFIP